uniref:p16 n=1 Tax=Leucania separata nucleopolyhedrovirus TaxID=1307956 RepID=O55564_NPVLS|nr:P16 [Leucania separata nucleopolyhedrovirus]
MRTVRSRTRRCTDGVRSVRRRRAVALPERREHVRCVRTRRAGGWAIADRLSNLVGGVSIGNGRTGSRRRRRRRWRVHVFVGIKVVVVKVVTVVGTIELVRAVVVAYEMMTDENLSNEGRDRTDILIVRVVVTFDRRSRFVAPQLVR